MHVLQPKHIKLKPEEVEKVLSDFNISLAQLPKIKIKDAVLEEGEYEVSDIVKIGRISEGKTIVYYRVVSI